MKDATSDSGFWHLNGAEHHSLTFRILFLADSIQVRWLMCWLSLGWAASFLLDPSIFTTRPYYAEMMSFASPQLWGIAFLLHFAGALWRIRERRERRAWALVINGWGSAVWGLNCYAQIVGAGHWVPSATADVGCWFMLTCAFISTGWNRSTQST